jgi:hypothetical protein
MLELWLTRRLSKHQRHQIFANVRSHAQANDQRLSNEDPLEEMTPGDDALPPNMVPIGLFESPSMRMEDANTIRVGLWFMCRVMVHV